MATETKPPGKQFDPGTNPAQDEFDKLIEKNFSAGDERTMEERAKKGSEEDKKSSNDNIQEKTPQEKQVNENSDSGNSLYSPDGAHQLTKMQPSFKGVAKFAKKNRGKLIIGGGAASLITLLIIGFFALLPFKILHIVNNLQSRFFASSESAVTSEANVLFSDYLRKYVMPGLTSCKGTIDKTCTPKSVSGTSLVSKLYTGWSNAQLENKLAENYGIEFSFQKSTGHYYMKVPGMTGNGANIDSFVHEDQLSLFSLDDYITKSNDPQFKLMSRNEVRQAVNDSLNKETKFKKVMYRFKVGRLLEEKYGIKRCIIACKLRDNFADWKNQKKNAAKAIVVQRIIQPRAQLLGSVMVCLLDIKCDPNAIDNTTGQCTVSVDCETNGEDSSKIDRDMQAKLDALIAKYGTQDVLALYNELVDKGFTQYAIEQIAKAFLTDAAAETAGTTASKAVPIVGWVNFAAQVVGNVDKAPQKIQKLSYDINTATMVQEFSLYRTYADEVKTGNVDSTILGSFVTSLGSLSNTDMGGVASAEQTPLYSDVVGEGNGSGTTNYVCNNGKPVPAGQRTCPELQLNNPNSFATILNYIKGLPGFNIISVIAGLWNSTAGSVFGYVTNFIGGLISGVGGYVLSGLGINLQAAIDKVAGPLMDAFLQYVVPAIDSVNKGGGRAFDLMAGGADVSGNDFAHNGLGGEMLSNQQVASILNQQQTDQQTQYNHESFFARMFDSSNNNSLVTKLAVAMPFGANDAKASLGSYFSNPFAKVASIFSTMFNVGRVHAATAQSDPFGISQYGYPIDDSVFSTDPEAYWNKNCSKDGTTIDMSLPVNATYHALATNGGNVTINPDTQAIENTITDPCFLIQAAIGSSGATYDSTLLTPDDQTDSLNNAVASATSTSSPPGTLPTGTAQVLASQLQQYIANGKLKCVSLDGVNNINCSDITNTAKSVSIKGGQGCQVNSLSPTLLGMLLELVQMNHTFTLSALCSDHSNTGATGHSGGMAADFNTVDGVFIGPSDSTPWTAPKVKAASQLDQDITSFMPTSTGFGQIQCHPTFAFLSSFVTFNDGCSHQHVQVTT